MKTLLNKKFKVKDTELSYLELCKSILNNPPAEGFTPSEMSKRVKVQTKLENCKDKIELEDAEFETLKQSARLMKWAILSKEISEFHEEINKL